MGSLRRVLHLRLVGVHNCVIFVAASMDLVGMVNLNYRDKDRLNLGKGFEGVKAEM
jgi:hypothetical protein